MPPINTQSRRTKLLVSGFVLAAIALTAIAFSTRDTVLEFEADTLSTSEFKFSELKVEAHDGIWIGAGIGTRSSSMASADGGALVTGKMQNISSRELFIPIFHMTGVMATGPVTVELVPGVGTKPRIAFLSIPDMALERNDSLLSGYYLLPDQQIAFKLASAGTKISDHEMLEMGITWLVLDAESLEQREVEIFVEFEPSGTRSAWVDESIKWNFSRPVYREN